MLWNNPQSGGIAASPAAAACRVFFGSRHGFLYAVDARLGVLRWRRDLGSATLATPAIAGGQVFIGCRSGRFSALDASSGKVIWHYKASGAIRSGSCVADGFVYFGDLAGKVHKVRAADGEPGWPQQIDVGGKVLAAPILVGDILYGGSFNGKLWAIDAKEGFVGWSTSAQWGGGVIRAPCFGGGQVIFTTSHRNRSRGGVLHYTMHYRPPTFYCKGAGMALQIDGLSSDPPWEPAPGFAGFFQHNGLRRGEPVVVKPLWTKDTLYLSLALAEGTADQVRIMLGPRGDHLAAFEFALDAHGQRTQKLHLAPGQDRADEKTAKRLTQLKLDDAAANAWTAQWHARIARQPNWSAEIAIPFAAFPKTITGPPRHNHTWRINIYVKQGKRIWQLRPAHHPTDLSHPAGWPQLRFDHTPVIKPPPPPPKK